GVMSVMGSRFGRLAIAVSVIALLGSGLYLGSSTLDSVVPASALHSIQDKLGLGKESDGAQAKEFPFPRKIWQTDKSLEVKPQWKSLVSSWFSKNPTFR